MPPRDLILEPGEKILVATRPLYLWEPLLVMLAALVVGAIAATAQSADVVSGVFGAAALVLLLVMITRWVPWRAKWFVLTDRRVIARWGVLNRNQSALLLDRIQDASLSRPFPLSLFRDYGVLHLESAGVHSEERISEGLRDLEMTGATRFYRALTEAQTPGR